MNKEGFIKWPMYGHREKELLEETLKSGNWWRMSGSKVKEFEKLFAKAHNAKYCLGVSNGTHAIELALAALNIKKGDEVIIPAFTFISTFNAPIYEDIVPVPVDVDPDTFCMLPEAFEEAVTDRTKAVIPVHMAGHMCDMVRISQVAKKHGIKIIEDAAHAHGAAYKGSYAGEYSDAATFSFQNGKIMTCGEGGAIITNNEKLYERLYLIHGVGRPDGDKVYQHKLLGSNDRMSEFQAAILIAQLERLKEHNRKRTENACYLDTILGDIEGIKPQKQSSKITINSHYMYMFYYDKSYFNQIARDEFVRLLNENNIPAFIAYPVVSQTEFARNKDFRDHISMDYTQYDHALTNAINIAENVVWLPHYCLLSSKEAINRIGEVILHIQNGENKNGK